MLSRQKISFLLGSLMLAPLCTAAHAHLPGSPPAGKAARVVVETPSAPFALVDQNGKSFKSERLRGKLAVVTFIFTTCPDVCPLLTANLVHLQRMLKREGPKDFFLVSITTDPEVDTPEVLKSYAERFGVDFSTWAFLSGAEQQVKQVWRSFGVTVIKKGRGLVQHTGLTTLIDRQGVRRLNYYGDTWHEKEIHRDLLSLAGGN
jgi:protein SCO1/2